jgi:hypothetical protein
MTLRFFETSINFNQTTRRRVQKDRIFLVTSVRISDQIFTALRRANNINVVIHLIDMALSLLISITPLWSQSSQTKCNTTNLYVPN